MYGNSSAVSVSRLKKQRAEKGSARKRKTRNRRIFAVSVVVVALMFLFIFLTAFTKPQEIAPGIEIKCNENINNSAVITNVSLENKRVERQKIYTEEDVEFIAKTVYGEALVTQSDTEMAAVAWCILNRVDSSLYPDTVKEVVTQRRQFQGYSEGHPVTAKIENLVIDVLDRWCAEKNGATDCGRVLPKEYIYFEGDGRHNHYATEYGAKDYWDWDIKSPYES